MKRLALRMPANIENICEALAIYASNSGVASWPTSLTPLCYLIAFSLPPRISSTHRGGSEDPKRTQRGESEYKMRSITSFLEDRHKNSRRPSHFSGNRRASTVDLFYQSLLKESAQDFRACEPGRPLPGSDGYQQFLLTI